jgi:hypothetical protein
MSENTFAVVAIAGLVAAIWWDHRSKKPVASNPAGRTSTGQAYATPTSVAEQLARGVVGLTLGFLSGQPKGITPENARTAFRQAELQGDRAASSWSGPSQSIVYTDNADEHYGDSHLTAPVYDRTDTLVQNPFLLAAL